MKRMLKASLPLMVLTLALGGLRCVGADAMDGAEINCSNDKDDDGDGWIDCNDPDCDYAPYCTLHCNFNLECDGGENNNNCPTDCAAAVCGNGTCEAGETPQNCPADCSAGSCGNGMCEPGLGEDELTCPADCAAAICGNSNCETGETPQNCPPDCSTCNPSTEFQCFSGQCIPVSGRCNGVVDCTDGSDENATVCS